MGTPHVQRRRAPAVATNAATAITQNAATLHGTVNAEGSPTTYHFDYGKTTSYGSSAPVPNARAGSGTAPQPVAHQIAGLTPGTTYHFRLVAANAAGTTHGPDARFTTAPAPPPPQPPAVSPGAAAAIAPDTAVLQGTITAQGSPTSYHFDYGPDASYGSSVPVPDADAGSGSAPQPVTQQISGLAPGTTYHFRLVAANMAGTTTSPDATFTTAADPPVVTTGTPTDITPTTATLLGTVNAGGSPTSYLFGYGTTTNYSSDTGSFSMGAASTPQPVSQQISGLTPGTTYHVRLFANNAAGRVEGADVTFTTGAALPPAVSPVTVAATSPTSVTLQGKVNAEGSPTSYRFEYGTTASPTSVPVSDASAGSGSTPQPVTQQISGLTPLTTYPFRLVAANAGGTTVSPDVTFTTGAALPPAVSAVAAHTGQGTVTFQGTVNAQGLPTSYHFDHGPTTSYGSSDPVPDASAGSGSAPQPVTYTMSVSLEPAGSIWHCRIVATNSAGTAYGNDVAFSAPMR